MMASVLIEHSFERRERTDRTTYQVMGQERGTRRRFIEHSGDRPLDAYSRADVTSFLDALRHFPQSYGNSPKGITADVEVRQASRLPDKTVSDISPPCRSSFNSALMAGISPG